jgi:lipid A oxidase
MVFIHRIGKCAATASLISALLVVSDAQAELRLGAYSGLAETLDTDVELKQSGGTALTFEGVTWDDKSFTSPIYYGIRLTYWFHYGPSWGLGIDFTHAKMIADTDALIPVSGTRAGANVADDERLGDTFSTLELSHGHNLLMLNGLYRFSNLGWIEPYAGLGAGATIPHVETDVDAVETSEYQLAGPAGQGLVGVDIDVMKHLSVFAEYKLSYADIDADLKGGSILHVEPWTNHFIVGLSLGFF